MVLVVLVVVVVVVVVIVVAVVVAVVVVVVVIAVVVVVVDMVVVIGISLRFVHIFGLSKTFAFRNEMTTVKFASLMIRETGTTLEITKI